MGTTESNVSAVCVLRDNKGQVKGTARFQDSNIHIKVENIKPPGDHGIHIHEYGDFTNGCTSAGAHFNPFYKHHGGLSMNHQRHVGDLGNIWIKKDGTGILKLHQPSIKLKGPYSVIGRTLVLHSDTDDLGKGSSSLSRTTGNSGTRIAGGVIGISKRS